MDNKFIFICVCLVLIYCLSAVSAADLNQTDVNVKLNDNDDSFNNLAVDEVSHVNETDSQSHADECNNSLLDKNNFSDNHEKLNSSVKSNVTESVVYDNLSDVSLNQEIAKFYVRDSNQLNDLFSFVKNKNPSWGMLNITLAPNTQFRVGHDGLYDYDTHYAVRLTTDRICINGNHGSVISGDGNAFAYVTSNSQLKIVNVTLENFNKCFVSLGSVFCSNSTFNRNKQVSLNYNSVAFENCIFNKDDGYAGILDAQDKTLSVFYNCEYNECGDAFISAGQCSNVIVHSKTPIVDKFKGCKFNLYSYFSIISSETKDNVTVFNCSDVNQLYDAMYLINTFSPNGQIVINLEPKVYSLKSDTMFLRTSDFTLKPLNKTDILDDSIGYELFDFCLKVAFSPVLINGNGATINVADGNLYYHDVFANIGPSGVLVVNNVTFSDFNRVFNNMGTLAVNNCSFKNNIGGVPVTCDCMEGGCVLYSDKGNSYFENCTFINNYDWLEGTFGLKYSKLYIKNCNFDSIIPARASHDLVLGTVGQAYYGDVYCCDELKNTFYIPKADSENSCYYHSIDDVVVNSYTFKPNDVLVVNIFNSDYESNLINYLNRISPRVLIMNISCDCNISLKKFDMLGQLIIHGNGHKVVFATFDLEDCLCVHNNFTIGKKISIVLNNLTFSDYKCQYLFENHGNVIFNNCNFTNNQFYSHLMYNFGSCAFVKCTFEHNVAGKCLIYNSGYLVLGNCSFSDNLAKGDSDMSSCLIFSRGIIQIINSNFVGWDSKKTVVDNNTVNSVIYNSTGFCEKFNIQHYQKPVPPAPKKKSSWFTPVLKQFCIMTSVLVGSVIFVCTGSILVAVVLAAVGGALVGLNMAFFDNKYGGVDFSSAVSTYVPIGVVGGIIGAVSEYIPSEISVELAYNPFSDLIEVSAGKILNI